MGKRILIASLVFLNLVFITVIVYTQIKIRQVEKARQEAQQAVVSEEVGVGEEKPQLVMDGIPIREFKVEEGYPGVVDLGEFETLELSPEEGLEKIVEISGYVLEEPRDFEDGTQVAVRLAFPTDNQELIADVILGPKGDELGIYLPANGVITANQTWTIMKVSEIISLLRQGDQVIVQLPLGEDSEMAAFLEDLQKGEGELRTIGPVIQMIAWGRE